VERTQNEGFSKWFWFSHQTNEITSDLNILVYAISSGENTRYLHLSSKGLESGSSLERFWTKVPPVGPGNDVVRFEPVDTFNVAGVMMFAEGQQLFVGDLPDDVKLEIFTWRSSDRRLVLTGRVLLTLRAGSAQVFVRQKEVDASYIESYKDHEIAEVESADTAVDAFDVVTHEIDSSLDVLETEQEGSVLAELIDDVEPRMNRRPKKFWNNKRARLATAIVRTIFLCAFGFVTLLVLTPLGITHPSLPQDSSSLVITLPPGPSVHAGEEVVVVIGQDIVRGTVSKIGSSTIQIINGSSMTEVQIQDVVGRVVVSIPLIGRLL